MIGHLGTSKAMPGKFFRTTATIIDKWKDYDNSQDRDFLSPTYRRVFSESGATPLQVWATHNEEIISKEILPATIRARLPYREVYPTAGVFTNGLLIPSSSASVTFQGINGTSSSGSYTPASYSWKGYWDIVEGQYALTTGIHGEFGGLRRFYFANALAGIFDVAPMEWEVLKSNGSIQVEASTSYYATFWLEDTDDSRDLDVIVYDQDGNIITTASATTFDGDYVSVAFTTGAGDSEIFIEIAKPSSDTTPFTLLMWDVTVTEAAPTAHEDTEDNYVGVFL